MLHSAITKSTTTLIKKYNITKELHSAITKSTTTLLKNIT